MNRTAVEQIKDRLPIEEVVGSYVKIEKAGRSYKARCPFHNEKTPSFFVSPDRGGYYCFGCGAKGDIFSFVEQFEGLDFRGALKVLADRAGVELEQNQKADGERDQLFKIMEEAARFFELEFEKSPIAREYVKNRGIGEETRKLFRIGWAPDGWHNLHHHLNSRKWSDRLLEKAGLIKSKSEESTPGNFYDRFRGRIMFPITDSSGRVIAFSGRILADDGKSAKYLNSPDTPLYDKSSVLYGLDKAKGQVRRMNYSIIVEGQMDLVLSHQAGVANTVAASGTALADEVINESGIISNLGLVRRLSPNIIIAFDSDTAGRKAAMRAAGIALSMGMDVKIADLPNGKDPADLVRENPDAWKNVLRQAKAVIEFELGNVLRDEIDPRKLPRILRERVFPFLARIDSSMDKAHYVKMISERAAIAEDAVWQDLKKVSVDRTEKVATVQGNTVASSSGQLSSQTEDLKRIDLVERRMFGLLYLMEASNIESASSQREKIRSVAGKSYEDRWARAGGVIGDLAFEAEAVFGSDSSTWERHLNELVLNFEKDIVSNELISVMTELRGAERAGQSEKVAELAKRCQELSIKKAEIGKKNECFY